MVAIKVPLWKPISFIGATYKNMGEGLITGGENDVKTAASQKPTPAWVTIHKAGNLEHTEQPASSTTSGRVCSASTFPVGLSYPSRQLV